MRLRKMKSFVLFVVLVLWTIYFLVQQSLLMSRDCNCENNQAYMGPSLELSESDSRYKGVAHSVDRLVVLPQHLGPGNDGREMKFDKKNSYYKRERDPTYGFNRLLSDEIGVHRRLKDFRKDKCRDKTYRENLPPVSVIITCRDELPSLVLRTAYSVIEMSPSELIQEIIIVDDGSTNKELIAKLDFHVDNVKKFKLLRNNVSQGLMKARQAGIDASTADYFIVMDGHMEVGPYWLEPLIDRLIDNPKALLTSHVFPISTEDFSLKYIQAHLHFFFFDHITLLDRLIPYSKAFLNSRNYSVDPVQNAIIQGMMTVMKKEFFYQLGGFDTGMELWGFEQYEMSIKVWMCGGVVEQIPCSIVGHLYKQTPWTRESSKQFLYCNRARLARVWMDPLQQNIVLAQVPAGTDPGNLTDRIAIRNNNNCKPYQHFIDKVKSISGAYILDKPKQFGLLYNKQFHQCLEVHTDSRNIITNPCNGRGHQAFYLTEYLEIRSIVNSIINPFPNDKILGCSNLKADTDDKIDVDKARISIQHGMENIETKGETAGYQQFLLLSQCFPKQFLLGKSKAGLVWERVKVVRNNADYRIQLFDNPTVDESTEAQWDYLVDETIVNKGSGLCLTALPEYKVGLEKCSNNTEQKWTWAYIKRLPK